MLALAAERAIERVLGIAAAGLAHLKTPTKCESSQSLPLWPNQCLTAAAKLFGSKEVPTVRPRISTRPTQAGWRLYTLETQCINGWTREFGKLFRLLEDFTCLLYTSDAADDL